MNSRSNAPFIGFTGGGLKRMENERADAGWMARLAGRPDSVTWLISGEEIAAATPQGTVSVSGTTSIDRGDNTSFTVSLTNTGSSTLTGVQLSFNVSPSDMLRNLSPGNSVNVGDVAPGGSVSQTWAARADNEGSGSVTASASSNGTSLDSASQALTVLK